MPVDCLRWSIGRTVRQTRQSQQTLCLSLSITRHLYCRRFAHADSGSGGWLDTRPRCRRLVRSLADAPERGGGVRAGGGWWLASCTAFLRLDEMHRAERSDDDDGVRGWIAVTRHALALRRLSYLGYSDGRAGRPTTASDAVRSLSRILVFGFFSLTTM